MRGRQPLQAAIWVPTPCPWVLGGHALRCRAKSTLWLYLPVVAGELFAEIGHFATEYIVTALPGQMIGELYM